jgi:hypothetical protein
MHRRLPSAHQRIAFEVEAAAAIYATATAAAI